MKHFGLDYGTTTSLVYSYDSGYDSGNLTREFISLSAVKVVNGKVVETGQEAWNDPDRTGFVESPKRGINNLDEEHQEMIEALLFKMINLNGINPDLSHITLTVPYSYGVANYSSMYQMLSDCLRKRFGDRSFNIHLLPEPVAAALFYAHKHLAELHDTSHMVVCDIGGGTTDMCIIKCKKENGNLTFSIIEGGNQSSDEIGGNKFDNEIRRRICFPNGFSLIDKTRFCQRMKCNLSVSEEHSDYAENMLISMTRSEFEQAIDRHLLQLKEMMRAMLDRTQLEVDPSSWYILPIGGSCKIPAIRRCLEEVFVGARQTAEDENTIFDGVAQGAAIYSALKAGTLHINGLDEISIEHHTPHEIQFYSAYGSWQALVPENAKDGIYESPVKVISNSGNAIVNNGTYKVGEIKLREKKANAQSHALTHNKAFKLKGREVEDIILLLGVEIENCLIVRCWLKDSLTGEIQEWNVHIAKQS